MLNFRAPTYQKEYQARTISVYSFGDERVFFAQFNDKDGHPIGAAPKLYETIDAAVDVCKDLIDFIYGEIDCYQERPEAKQAFAYNTAAARPTAPLPHIFAL